MNADIENSIAVMQAAAVERGVETMALYRAEYRAVLELLVRRGYGTAAALNAEAQQYAERVVGVCPEEALAAAAWWTIGLACVQGEREYADPRLE